MTTVLEPPMILAAGKPPNTFDGDAPSPGAPAEREDTEGAADEADADEA
jgi:hypothetical protein